jgi:hypothetical protein
MRARDKTIATIDQRRLAEAVDRLIDLYPAANQLEEVWRWWAERARFVEGPESKPIEGSGGCQPDSPIDHVCGAIAVIAGYHAALFHPVIDVREPTEPRFFERAEAVHEGVEVHEVSYSAPRSETASD